MDERHRAICRAVAALAPGEVVSYGELARRAGLPGRARLVGRVLKKAPASLQLPWHRVLRADGSLAFPEDSPAWREQRDRLASEGVQLLKGRVPRSRMNRDLDLDRSLWGPE